MLFFQYIGAAARHLRWKHGVVQGNETTGLESRIIANETVQRIARAEEVI